MKPFAILCTAAAISVACASAQASILFDFENITTGSAVPFSDTVSGVTAKFSSPDANRFYVSNPHTQLGFYPQGFSGNAIMPRSTTSEDLRVGFSQLVTDCSLRYAVDEYGPDTSAVMRISAYKGGSLVGTATAQAILDSGNQNWPAATLSFSSSSAFDSIVVHYETRPSGGENVNPIFAVDNVQVTLAPIPEPSGAPVVIGLALLLGGVVAGGRQTRR
jgi:hypothetical protein